MGLTTTKLRLLLRRARHPAGLGFFRRTSPVSMDWGFDRGTPVDRFYIERFLNEYRADIRGRVLEVKDAQYSTRFGVGVTQIEVLDIDDSNQDATLIGDLSKTDGLPTGSFDCFVLTQTLQYIFDIRSALENAYGMLSPNGVLLVTAPSVSRIDPEASADFWRFTTASCSRLFGDVFGPENITVTSYGNVLTCCAFLQGFAAEELSASELAVNDPAFPLILAIRAQKKS
jgi:SAM-dependent methyltransferase